MKKENKINFRKVFLLIFEIIFLLFLHIKYSSLTEKPLSIDFSNPLPMQQAVSEEVIKNNDNNEKDIK